MKRIIALMLCLIMPMSLVACGGSASTEETVDTSAQTEATTTSEQIAESESLEETTVSEETNATNDSSEPIETEESVIDKLPKPENTEISTNEEGYPTYTLANATFQDVMNYEAILKEEGFYIYLTSHYGNYEAVADNVYAEIKIAFYYTGTDYISNPNDFAERAKQGVEDPGSFNVTIRARDLGSYNLPELPEGDWRTNDNMISVNHKLNTYVNCSKAERVLLAKNYVELLKNIGYTLNVEEYPDGKPGNYVAGYESLYYFYAEDEIGNCVTVKVSTSEVFDPYNTTNVDDWSEIEISLKKVINN